jgi:diguanylate cyclase (GGDEF)-like protein
MHKRKDGTVFPIEASVALMKTGGKKLILSIFRNISKRRQGEKERERLIKKLKHISQTDGLTGLSNRQHLNRRLAEEIHRAKRYGNSLSLIMFDIDNFKKINDTYGHITGDKILQKTAIIIKKTLRDTDIAGRFGGDEFALILVQTDIDVGTQVAERIRAKIEQAQVPFKEERPISFTISLGICQYNDKLKSVQEFIAKTDRALYMAKYKGCNCVYRAED